jgi:DNA-binding beta-propeller fold protein YncE
MSGGQMGRTTGLIGPGGVWFVKFHRPGVFTYLCGIHPYMRGEVHVGGSFTPPAYAVDAPAPLPPTPGVGEIWVCCQFQDWTGKPKDGVVQVIDASTWAVTHLIPVGNNPHNLWFGAGNTEAAVTNWFDATVSRIDAVTKAVTSECVAGATPAHITSDYAGNNWYVSVEGSHYLTRYDQGSGMNALCSMSMMPPDVAWLSGYGPHGIWYGNGKLVTSNSMDSTFSIVDANTMTELTCLPAGMMPMGASTDSTGTLGASGNMMGSSVGIYDLVGLRRIRNIPLTGMPIQVPFSPDDQYVFAANSGQVSVIDAAKAADRANYPDPLSAIVANIATGKGAHGVAFGAKSGGGTYAYVSHKFENYVSVIDLSTMSKVGDVPLVTTTTGKVSLAGATDTGGNGIAVRPNPTPWQ